MGDGRIQTFDTVSAANLADASNKLVEDSTSDKLGRVGEVTVKGLANSPVGLVHAAENFVKPENWGKDAINIGSSAVLGAAMRVALPESGAVKAGVGLVMGYMFLKDAAKPIGQAWSAVYHDKSDKTMQAAAQQMGDGLGEFAVQGGVSVVSAGLAARVTPGLMESVAPKAWTKIENWKADNLVGSASSVKLTESADVGKFTGARQAPEHIDLTKGIKLDVHTATPEINLNSSLEHVSDVKRPGIKDLSPEQLKAILADHNATETLRMAGGKFERFGLKGSDGNYHSHDDVIQLLLDGKDPAVEPAGARTVPTAKTVSLVNADLAQPNGIVLGDQAPASHLVTEETADVSGKRGGHKPKAPADGGADKPQGSKPEAGKAPENTDAARPPEAKSDAKTDAKKGDGSDKDAGKTTDNAADGRLLTAKNLSAQAEAIKHSLTLIPDQDGLIMDAMNRNLGAIDVRTNPNVRPLKGYDVARKAAFNLAERVGTDPESFQQVNGLYDRFAAGALQSGSTEASDIAAHVARMDLYAEENFNTYRQNIIDQGINPDVALAQKPAPPLVEGTSDVERIGTDKDGNPVYAHEGPHTLRSIYGPNGEEVWPLDMVKTPIREIGMRGVNTSGIYGHELMHDQFGQMAKFDPDVRDAKLGDAAAKAWGDDAHKMVDLPDGGKDPQQVLLDAVVRQLGKVDPADHDAFLTEKLGLDGQTRVIRAAREADHLLGPAGRSMVQVPGTGTVPLEVLVGNIAAMADGRAPTEVLAEMQGKGDATATAQAIRANIDKILGPNGKQMLPLADGSHLSLSDTVMKVSDATRNPKFDTYDKPLPKQMSNADILVNVAKAWADETFADWGAAAESGQSAAPYFQALSKDGLLRGATVRGQDMRGPDNELGIEAHPTDKLRPRYQAALVRALATAKGGHDQLLLDWADDLDKYSRDAAPAGPIQFPSMDSPGKTMTIPEEVFDKFLPALVDAQLNTPLPRLEGKTLFDILPDLRKNFRINQSIADGWISAIESGKPPSSLPFDAPNTKMTHVYGAGQLTFLKLVNDGMDPIKANDAVNAFSDFFGDALVKDRAKATEVAPPMHKLNFASMAHTLDESVFQPVAADKVPGFASIGNNTFDASVPLTTQRNIFMRAGSNVMDFASNPNVVAATTAFQIQDLLGLQKIQQKVLEQP